jgi:hypothetical protein
MREAKDASSYYKSTLFRLATSYTVVSTMTIIYGTSAFRTMFSNLFSLQNFLQAICGALGSCFSMTMLHPFEISRTRLQVDPNITPRSSIPLIFSIHKNEGLEALYRGWASIIFSLSATNFVYFFTFHGMRSLPGYATASNDLLWSAVAGIITVLVTNLSAMGCKYASKARKSKQAKRRKQAKAI